MHSDRRVCSGVVAWTTGSGLFTDLTRVNALGRTSLPIRSVNRWLNGSTPAYLELSCSIGIRDWRVVEYRSRTPSGRDDMNDTEGLSSLLARTLEYNN